MVKGAQKRMVVVKINDSEVFEEAYFVLRHESRGEENDMVAEANRIIEECGGRKGKRSKYRIKELIRAAALFLGGGTLGGVAVGLLSLLGG